MLQYHKHIEPVRNKQKKSGNYLKSLSDIKVIDVDLKYGYESPEAFSKAFRKLHGLNPSEARMPGVKLQMYPQLSFTLSIKGDLPMEYRIEKKDYMVFMGKVLRYINQNEGHRIPEFVDKCYADGIMDRMFELANSHEDYALYMEPDMKYETFSYMVAVKKPDGTIVPDDMEEFTVPASTWAIFTAHGTVSQSLSSLRQRIFGEWFPSSDYEHANAPMLEVFPAIPGNSPDFYCEIWIPIIKKSTL